MKKHLRLKIGLLFLGFLFNCSNHLSAKNLSIKEFNSASLSLIEESYTGQPFVLIVWSIDCLPCREEFEMIREVKILHPKLNVVTVATESFLEYPEVEVILEKIFFQKAEHWAYAVSHSSKIRYSLDPKWYGELPRAYFYNRLGKRIPVSGAIKKSQLLEWFSEVRLVASEL